MPFSTYKDFKDCVAQNRDKDNPQAYCAEIKKKAEGLEQNESIKGVTIQMDSTENPYIIKDVPLLSEGIWNEHRYPWDEINNSAQGIIGKKFPVFLDHEDTVGNMVGSVIPTIVDQNKRVIYGDMSLIDENTIKKVDHFRKDKSSAWIPAVSPTLEADVTNEDDLTTARNLDFKNWSIVVDPACKSCFITNMSRNVETGKTIIAMSYKPVEVKMEDEEEKKKDKEKDENLQTRLSDLETEVSNLKEAKKMADEVSETVKQPAEPATKKEKDEKEQTVPLSEKSLDGTKLAGVLRSTFIDHTLKNSEDGGEILAALAEVGLQEADAQAVAAVVEEVVAIIEEAEEEIVTEIAEPSPEVPPEEMDERRASMKKLGYQGLKHLRDEKRKIVQTLSQKKGIVKSSRGEGFGKTPQTLSQQQVYEGIAERMNERTGGIVK